MSRRAILWIAFVLVHVWVAVLGWHQPNAPMGDVYLVYERWSAAWLNGGYIDPSVYGLTKVREYVGFVGIDESWVYPQLAIIPMLLARAFSWIAGYTPAWAILVTIIDALAFAVLVGCGRSRGRVSAAWFWLAFLALIGPIGLYRIDTVTVALAVAGGLWLIGRPWLGSSLLAIGVWIKVWPAAIIAAALIALRRRFAVIGGAIVVTAATAVAVVLVGGGSHLLGFIGDQTGRGLQIEAPVSTFYLWRSALMLPDSDVLYDSNLLTFQVTGPLLNQVIAIMTPLLVIVMAAVAGLGAYKVWRRASFARLFPALTLALVLGFIVFNKVGSPQYQVWLIAPLALGLVLDRRRWVRPALLGLVIALLTQIVYPLMYDGLMLSHPYPLPTLMLTLRNAAVVALFVWTVVILVKVPVRRAVGAASRTSIEPAVVLADRA